MRLIDADALIQAVHDLPNCPDGYSDVYDKQDILDLIGMQTIRTEHNKTDKVISQMTKAKDELREVRKEKTKLKRRVKELTVQLANAKKAIEVEKDKSKRNDVIILKRDLAYQKRKYDNLKKSMKRFEEYEKLKDKLWMIDDYPKLRKRYINYVKNHK